MFCAEERRRSCGRNPEREKKVDKTGSKKTSKKTLNHIKKEEVFWWGKRRKKWFCTNATDEEKERERTAKRPKKWREGKKDGDNKEEEEEELEESTGSRAIRTNFYTFADPLAAPLATGAPGPANSLPAFPFWLVFAAAAFSLVST